MGTLGAFLTAAVGPLAKRVLAALGFGIVSYIGADFAADQLLATARVAWTGAGGEAAAYVAMAGLNDALAIIAGAIVARVSLATMKRFALL
jgi:hypothetical protein